MGVLALTGGTPVRTKPFQGWPVFGKEEETAVLEVLHSGKWWFGEKVHEFERQYAAFHDAKHGVSCCNGTIALEIALRAMGVGPGDEVLVPAYTFIATASAVHLVGGKAVFVDVEEDSVNIDLAKAEAAITPRTKVLAVVHFAGLPVDMDAARALAKKRGLMLLEDAAHAWGTKWKGKGAGAIGDMGTFSFQMSKNITSGEGGIILSDDDELAAVARSISNCGRREGGAWYGHQIIGGNYRLNEFQGALLLAQLGRLEQQTLKREENIAVLDAELAKVPGIHRPAKDARITRRSHHLYNFRYVAAEFGGLPRAKFLEALGAEGVAASPGYQCPVYKNPAFQDMPGAPHKDTHCPVAERLCAEEAVWMTHSMFLGTAEDMMDVAKAIRKIHENQKELV
jgi:dTDP-4-amino-4,6-dideoxygalactose transaminase